MVKKIKALKIYIARKILIFNTIFKFIEKNPLQENSNPY